LDICPTPIEYWVATTRRNGLAYYEKCQKKEKSKIFDMYGVLNMRKNYPAEVGISKNKPSIKMF